MQEPVIIEAFGASLSERWWRECVGHGVGQFTKGILGEWENDIACGLDNGMKKATSNSVVKLQI